MSRFILSDQLSHYYNTKPSHFTSELNTSVVVQVYYIGCYIGVTGKAQHNIIFPGKAKYNTVSLQPDNNLIQQNFWRIAWVIYNY